MQLRQRVPGGLFTGLTAVIAAVGLLGCDSLENTGGLSGKGDGSTKTASNAPARNSSGGLAIPGLGGPSKTPKADPAGKSGSTGVGNGKAADPAGSGDTKADPAATPAAPAAPAVIKSPPQTVKLAKSMWDKTFYKDAKVGDWVESESEVAGQKTATKQEVIKAGDHTVTIRMSTKAAAFSTETEMTYEFTEADPPETKVETKADPSIKTETTAEEVTVGDKKVMADKTVVTQNDKVVSTSWVSKEVPLGGVVKSEANGFVTKLVAFGKGK